MDRITERKVTRWTGSCRYRFCCTISMAASSMLLEEVHRGELTMDQVLEMDYNEMIEQLGRQIVASRPKCATLGLGTLKTRYKKVQKERAPKKGRRSPPRRGGACLRRERRRGGKERLVPAGST